MPAEPVDEDGVPIPPRLCRECGWTLEPHEHAYCDDCTPPDQSGWARHADHSTSLWDSNEDNET